MPEALQPNPDPTTISEQDLDQMLTRAGQTQSPEDASAPLSRELHGQYFGYYVNDVPLLEAEIRRLRRLLAEQTR